MVDKLIETPICECQCHDVGGGALHCMPCCELTYEPYIVNGVVDLEMWSKAFQEGHGELPTIKSEDGQSFWIHK